MQYQRADGSPYFGMKLTEEHLEARLLADILEDLPIPSGETPDPGALFSSRAEAMASMNGAARSVLMNTPKRRQRPRLLNADKAEALFPDLVLERPGITSHFRVHFTARQCLESWMYAHNESGNIWTHLAGAGAAVGILICICSGMPLCTQCMLTAADRAVIASYAAGAVVCLSSSVIYHTFNCCSKTSYACCKRLDHAGVLCLLVASDLPMIYFGFYGKPLLQSIYLGLVLAITVAAGFVMLAKQRTDSRFHVTRQLIFIGLVAVGWSHMVHEVAMKGGMSTEEGRASAWCWVSSFGFYAAGFAFFLTKFPERAWPGAFDLWGHSHQLWHLLILAGATMHFHNLFIYVRIAKGLPLP